MSDTQTPEPTPEDIRQGKAAFEELLPRYKTLSPDGFARLNADIPRGATAVLGVAKRVVEPALYDRYKSLPVSEFDITNVDILAKTAWATLYAHAEAKKARALASDAKLPADLVQKAVTIESRMQACCEYHLADHPEAGSYVTYLRAGSGHRDIASDLLGYAGLYVEHHAIVKDDKKHYRPTDAEEAVKVAEQMLSLLGEGLTPEGKLAADNLTRAWTLLAQVYDEVRDTGLWLLRRDPDAAKLFPALYAAARSNQGGRPRKKAEAPPAS